MAGLPWIPLSVEFPDSAKAVALGVALQDPLAWAYVVRLWTWCAKNAADGRIEGPASVAVLEHAACWKGSPGAFVEAASLAHVRLLDQTEKGYAVHDWQEHCGAHVEKREKDRVRMRAARKRNRSRTVREPNAHVRGEREREKEKETEKQLLPLGDFDARAEGAKDRAAIDARTATPDHDALVAALHADGIDPVPVRLHHRKEVDAAVREAGLTVAVDRVKAAWDPTCTSLLFYTSVITGRPKPGQAKPQNIRTGSAAPARHEAFGKGGVRAIE